MARKYGYHDKTNKSKRTSVNFLMLILGSILLLVFVCGCYVFCFIKQSKVSYSFSELSETESVDDASIISSIDSNVFFDKSDDGVIYEGNENAETGVVNEFLGDDYRLDEKYVGIYYPSADKLPDDKMFFFKLNSDGTCDYPGNYKNSMMSGYWYVVADTVILSPDKYLSDDLDPSLYVFERSGYMIPNRKDTWMSMEDFKKFSSDYAKTLEEYNEYIISISIVNDTFTFEDMLFTKQ